MDAFWIKLFVMLVLCGLFALTVWVTPWLFSSSTRRAPAAGAPAEPLREVASKTARGR